MRAGKGLKAQAAKEQKEHPWATRSQARRIAADHAKGRTPQAKRKR